MNVLHALHRSPWLSDEASVAILVVSTETVEGAPTVIIASMGLMAGHPIVVFPLINPIGCPPSPLVTAISINLSV